MAHDASTHNMASAVEPAMVRWGHALSRAMAVIACIALFALMLLTFIDVIGRNQFLTPVPAAYELISLIMPLIIFCALPYVNLTGGHVTIDLLDGFIPRFARRAQHVIVHLISAAALGFMAWRLAMRSFDHHEYQEVTVELYLPMWPFSTAMAVLAALAALVMVVAAFLAAPNRDLPTGKT